MADINFDIELIMKNFEASLLKQEKLVEDFGDKFQKSTKKNQGAWDSFVGNLGAQTFIAIGKSVLDMGKSFIDAAADIEEMTVGFTTLTGSAETAQSLIEELQKFGAETPFEMKGLATASKSLLAYGFQASEIIPKLKQIGDVSSATGASLTEVAQVYGQVSAAGKLTGERLNQFQEKGIPILAALATELGTTSAKAREMISSTNGVSFATFEKAFATLSAEGGIAFDGMIKQSKTFKGVMSTAGDEVTMFAADMGAKLLPSIKAVVLQVGAFIKVLREIVDWAIKNKEILIPLAAAITVVSVATLLWAQRTAILTAATTIATTAQAAFNAVMSANPVGIVILAIGALTAAIVYFARNTEECKIKFYEFSIGVLKSIEPMEQGFRKIFGNIITIFAMTTGTLIQGAINLGGAFASVFGVELPEGLTAFKDNLLATAEAVTTGSGTITKEIDRLSGKVKGLKAELAKPVEKEKTAKGLGPGSDKEDTAEAEVAKAQELAERLKNVEMVFQMEMAGLRTDAVAQRLAAESTNEELSTEQRLAKEAAALEAAYQFELSKINVTLEAETQKANALKDANDKEVALKQAQNKAALDTMKLQNKNKADLDKQAVKTKSEMKKEEEKIEESYINSARGFLQVAGSLAKQGSREAKAIAITDATIATYLGAAKALKDLPTPANFIASGAVIASGLASVHKITSAGSFATGGIVRGLTPTGDRLTAQVNKDEAILTTGQQRNFMDIANGKNKSLGADDEVLNVLWMMYNELKQGKVLMADDNELARSVSRGVANGIVIGESK